MKRFLPALLIALAACSPPAQNGEPMPIEGGPQAVQAPPDVLAVIQAADANFVAREAVEDSSTGAQTFRVSGASNGADASYRLMRFNEGWRIIHIERDIAWADAPAAVRDVVANSPAAVVPTRVVELSEPGADGTMYDLYTGETLAMTVRLVEGGAAIMPPPH